TKLLRSAATGTGHDFRARRSEETGHQSCGLTVPSLYATGGRLPLNRPPVLSSHDTPALLIPRRLVLALLAGLFRVALCFSFAVRSIAFCSFISLLFPSQAGSVSRRLSRRWRRHFLIGSRHLDRGLFILR